ncbi:MAG: hypothetical protein ACREQL_12095, partial [Candidatus Binatia bacterium]
AVDYARRLGGHLHIFHVFSEGEFDVTRLLADAAALAGRDVPVTVASAGGDPAEGILHYAAVHSIRPAGAARLGPRRRRSDPAGRAPGADQDPDARGVILKAGTL